MRPMLAIVAIALAAPLLAIGQQQSLPLLPAGTLVLMTVAA